MIYSHNIVFRINIGLKNPVDIFQLVQQFDRFLVVKYFDGPHYLHGIARVQKTDQMGAIAKEQVPPVRSQPPAVYSFRAGEFSCLIQAGSIDNSLLAFPAKFVNFSDQQSSSFTTYIFRQNNLPPNLPAT